ncbi:hypothetical protein SMJ63A_140019 [Stenotrophomonas geniculata]|jgi:hypothetical protein
MRWNIPLAKRHIIIDRNHCRDDSIQY